MDSLQALRQQRQEYKRRASELRHEQQQCKRQKGDLPEELSRLSISRLQRVRLLIFMWQANCSAWAAALMLEHSRVHFDWSDWQLAERENFVQDIFLDTPVEDLVDLLNQEEPDLETARREAQRLHAEYQTMQWTHALNSECAVAPQWTDVRDRHLAHEAQNNIVADTYRRQPRSWCQRWRERWGGHVKKLKTGEHDQPAILQEKATREPGTHPGKPFDKSLDKPIGNRPHHGPKNVTKLYMSGAGKMDHMLLRSLGAHYVNYKGNITKAEVSGPFRGAG